MLLSNNHCSTETKTYSPNQRRRLPPLLFPVIFLCISAVFFTGLISLRTECGYRSTPIATENLTAAPFVSDMPFGVFTYTLGVGAWSTDMEIRQDGTFSGIFHDSNMGDIGSSHPDGTMYTCTFDGSFKYIGTDNDYSAEYEIDRLELHELHHGCVRDGMLYVMCEPYGLKEGAVFTLYSPDTPVSDLPQDILLYRKLHYPEYKDSVILSVYVFYSDELGSVFLPNDTTDIAQLTEMID